MWLIVADSHSACAVRGRQRGGASPEHSGHSEPAGQAASSGPASRSLARASCCAAVQAASHAAPGWSLGWSRGMPPGRLPATSAAGYFWTFASRRLFSAASKHIDACRAAGASGRARTGRCHRRHDARSLSSIPGLDPHAKRLNFLLNLNILKKCRLKAPSSPFHPGSMRRRSVRSASALRDCAAAGDWYVMCVQPGGIYSQPTMNGVPAIQKDRRYAFFHG